MSLETVQKYIFFQEVANEGKKTRRWWVVNKTTGAVVGTIYWRPGWRKYVFESGESYYDWDCLRLIADFIENQTKLHYMSKNRHRPA